jgi:preprotein translocase subunit Sss1
MLGFIFMAAIGMLILGGIAYVAGFITAFIRNRFRR